MLLIPAWAKLNLCLAVRRRRHDGYHEIDSVAVTVDWHDLVGIAARPSTVPSVTLRASGLEVPTGEANLAVQAARAVVALAGPLALELWLDKRVPSAAGLGSGSADAAAVLRGCVRLADRGLIGEPGALEAGAVARVAESLGSDVPMLLAGGAQRMRGRGEVLEALPPPPLHAVVAVAAESSTAGTYAAVEPVDLEGSERPEALAAALREGKAPDDDLLGSGLEAAACRASAVLDERLTGLRASFPEVRWHLTGSGGAAFALVGDGESARQIAGAATALGFPARACRTVGG